LKNNYVILSQRYNFETAKKKQEVWAAITAKDNEVAPQQHRM
jgi:hypothetical protein